MTLSKVKKWSKYPREEYARQRAHQMQTSGLCKISEEAMVLEQSEQLGEWLLALYFR